MVYLSQDELKSLCKAASCDPHLIHSQKMEYNRNHNYQTRSREERQNYSSSSRSTSADDIYRSQQRSQTWNNNNYNNKLSYANEGRVTSFWKGKGGGGRPHQQRLRSEQQHQNFYQPPSTTICSHATRPLRHHRRRRQISEPESQESFSAETMSRETPRQFYEVDDLRDLEYKCPKCGKVGGLIGVLKVCQSRQIRKAKERLIRDVKNEEGPKEVTGWRVKSKQIVNNSNLESILVNNFKPQIINSSTKLKELKSSTGRAHEGYRFENNRKSINSETKKEKKKGDGRLKSENPSTSKIPAENVRYDKLTGINLEEIEQINRLYCENKQKYETRDLLNNKIQINDLNNSAAVRSRSEGPPMSKNQTEHRIVSSPCQPPKGQPKVAHQISPLPKIMVKGTSNNVPTQSLTPPPVGPPAGKVPWEQRKPRGPPPVKKDVMGKKIEAARLKLKIPLANL